MMFPELRFFTLLSLIMPIFFATMWISSATIDGEWTFGVNSLSDMGISDNAISAFLFNIGCIVTGLGGFMISIGTFAYGKKTLKFGGLIAAASFIFLSLVGVFTLNIYPIHSFVASTFGVLLFISIIVSSVSDYKVSWYLYTDVILVAIMAITMMTLKFEVWEPIYTICSIIWTFTFGIKMLIGDERLFSDVPQTRRG